LLRRLERRRRRRPAGRHAAFYGTGIDQLHLAFNFPFTFAALEAGALREIVERTQASYPPEAWPAWMLSNHDIPRFATRMCAGDERKIRCALLALSTLRERRCCTRGTSSGSNRWTSPRIGAATSKLKDATAAARRFRGRATEVGRIRGCS